MPSIQLRKRLHLLYVLVTLNIIFFLVVYRRLVLITPTNESPVDVFITSILHESSDRNESIDILSRVSSSVCYIPHFDPWDQTVAKSIRIRPVYRCPTNKHDLIHVVNFNQLKINQTVNRTSFANSVTHCVYLKIGRNPEEKFFRDWSYTLSEPILIENGMTQAITDSDFVLTRCYNDRTNHFDGQVFCGSNCSESVPLNDKVSTKASTKKFSPLIYEYVHPLFNRKKSPFNLSAWSEKTSENWLSQLISPNSPNRAPPSVILIILDAVSNLQARRALPQTLAYLKSQGLITFQRHAIVGDGTFENIVPLLFGKPASLLQKLNTNDSRYEFIQTQTKVEPKTKRRYQIKKVVHYPGPFDNYPFLVKNFSKLNYTTFFSEEWRESAFYNLKNGFRQVPTDFYLRPYWLSLYETMSYNKYPGNSNPKPCYLNKLLHFLSLDWLEQFLRSHQPSQLFPTFGILKMNEMSHDYLERLFWIDKDLKMFFERLVNSNLLDNTILMFSGDHGHRQHRLRLTRIGSFEVKLPFFSILLPSKFRQNFPAATKNMKNNENTLTSWWDVYETIANVLRMVEQPDVFDPLLVNWKPTTSGTSMFHPIPERNCSTAGIPDKYCPCSRSTAVDSSLAIVKAMTLASIEYINSVKLKEHKHLCLNLQLKQVIRAEVEVLDTPQSKKKISGKSSNFSHLYTVLFELEPSGGIFESRVYYDESTKKYQVNNDILRINLYGQTSACIQDKYELRSFCYCISYHNKLKSTQTSTSILGNTVVVQDTVKKES